jgi:hypothetical protein
MAPGWSRDPAFVHLFHVHEHDLMTVAGQRVRQLFFHRSPRTFPRPHQHRRRGLQRMPEAFFVASRDTTSALTGSEHRLASSTKRSTRKAWVEAGHPKSMGYGTACTATSDTRAFNPALSAIARSKTALAMDGSVYVTASSISAHSPSLAREPGSIRSSPRLFMIVTSSKGTGRGVRKS